MLRSMTQLDGSTAVTDFDRTTALIPVEARPGEFLVDLDGGWSSLVGVHGGYMCALAVRGAESLAPGRVVRTMSTSFLRSGRVGPAVLSVREVRRGRSITTMVAELVQDDQILTASRLTLMTARSGRRVERAAAARPAAAGGLCAVLASGSCGELRTVRVAVRSGPDAVHRRTRPPRRVRAPARGAPDRRRMAGDGRRLASRPLRSLVPSLRPAG